MLNGDSLDSGERTCYKAFTVDRMGTVVSITGDHAALRPAHSRDSYFYFWRFS